MKTLDIILILFFIALVVFGVFSIRLIYNKQAQCLAKPIEYGIQQFEKTSNSNIYCMCYSDSKDAVPIIVTSNGTSTLKALPIIK